MSGVGREASSAEKHAQRLTISPTAGTELGGGVTATRIPCYIFGGCCCFILLFLQLFFHLRWHRVRAQLSG